MAPSATGPSHAEAHEAVEVRHVVDSIAEGPCFEVGILDDGASLNAAERPGKYNNFEKLFITPEMEIDTVIAEANKNKIVNTAPRY